MTRDPRGFTTRATRGVQPVVTQRPASTPIYQSATFAFDDLDEFADVSRRKTSGGYLYSRWANPTVQALAETIAALEGTEATACLGSGMAAIHGALMSVLRSGDHVVAARQVYGGTYSLLAEVLPRSGVEVTFVDVVDLDQVEAAFGERTRVLYVETIGNPMLPVADLDQLSGIARGRDAVTIVDATFTPPCMLRPIEHGADLVMHSATKYLGGHSDITAGVVSGSAERIDAVRRYVIDTGAILAPFEAWLCARGLATVDLRMTRICDTAGQLAAALESHASVERVLYPGLPSHPQHDLAKRLLGDRCGGMIAFDVAGGAEAGRRFLAGLRLVERAASLGGTKSLAVHPASVTHTQLDAEALRAAGMTEGTIRLSVGIEDAEDVLADVLEALA